MSRDPIEEEGGLNLYGYVENDPLSFTDPLGLDSVNLFRQFDPNCQLANDRGINKKEVTVGAHANREALYDYRTYPEKKLSPKELAIIIKRAPDYSPAKPVRLNACSSAQGDNSAAQQLSKELPNSIIGSTTDTEVDFRYINGRPMIGSPVKPSGNGKWRTFQNGKEMR